MAADYGNISSKLNSSSEPLSAGGSFIGEAERVSAYESLTVAVYTDKDGYYTVQFSVDGENWDSTLIRYYTTTHIEPPHRFTITRSYVRVRFYNTSGEDQNVFRLETMYGDKQQLNIPLDANMAQDYDAIAVRPTDFKYEVALGRRQGHTTWNKFGYNDNISIGTAVVAAFGGTTLAKLSTASTFTIVSSSSEDTLTTGTGAWNVVIYYIDADRRSATAVVPLTGQTPVVTAFTGLGINRVALYNSGSTESNVGNITITATTGGSTQALVPAGQGTTQQCVFYTQSDHQALMDYMLINAVKTSGGSSPKITIRGWVYSWVSGAKYLVFKDTLDTAVENHLELKPAQPFVVGEKSVFWLEATTDQNSTNINARFSLVEVRDVDA